MNPAMFEMVGIFIGRVYSPLQRELGFAIDRHLKRPKMPTGWTTSDFITWILS